MALVQVGMQDFYQNDKFLQNEMPEGNQRLASLSRHSWRGGRDFLKKELFQKLLSLQEAFAYVYK